jgi:toxin YhaV
MARSRSNQRPLPANPIVKDAEVVNGWTLLFHPLLLEQLERLTTAAEADRLKQRKGGTPPTSNLKVLSGLRRLIFERVPQDPAREEFQQGNTLGSTRRHWFRAKFGAGRFRLFFRYRRDIKVIVYAWVNDADTLRTYGSRTDAYAVFRSMLDNGNPPESWDDLVAAATDLRSIAQAGRAKASRPTPALSAKRRKRGLK